jgi:hypothetical protein
MAIRMITGLGLAASALGLAFVACGPSTSEPGPNTSASSTDSSSTSAPVTSTAATTSSAAETSNAGPNACDGPGDTYVSEMLNDGNCETTAPPNCLINEFAETFGCDGDISGVGTCSECCWGDDTSLSGGQFTYKDSIADYAPITSSIEFTQGAASLSLTGTAVEYAGFIMWFGPCTDASTWDGVELQVTGTLGGGQLFVQLQTDEDHPDQACPHGEDDDWEVCGNPQYLVAEGITTDGLTPIKIPWAQFTGGKPNPDVNPKQLRGIQIQVGCALATADSSDATSTSSDSSEPKPTEPCAFNVEVHDLRWYKD